MTYRRGGKRTRTNSVSRSRNYHTILFPIRTTTAVLFLAYPMTKTKTLLHFYSCVYLLVLGSGHFHFMSHSSFLEKLQYLTGYSLLYYIRILDACVARRSANTCREPPTRPMSAAACRVGIPRAKTNGMRFNGRHKSTSGDTF